MDILRVLTTPDLEVRKKTLQLALDLVSSRNVEEVCVNTSHFKGLFTQKLTLSSFIHVVTNLYDMLFF